MTDRLYAAAERALDALNDLIRNTFDPGTEALGARYELAAALTSTPPGVRDAARQAAGQQPERACALPEFMGCECNHLSDCEHPAVGKQDATQPAETHSADELKAAAFLLRNPMRGLTIGVDTDLSYPLADWLDHQAAMTEHLHNLVDGMPSSDGHPALAVARAINGTAP